MAKRAITSFTAAVEGLGQPVVTRDAVFADDHPIVLAHPSMFEAAELVADGGIAGVRVVRLKRKRRGVSKPTETRG